MEQSDPPAANAVKRPGIQSQKPNFRDPGHPQSGPCTCSDSPFSRKGALYEPVFGPVDPLSDAKLLEDFA
jgi:hypothetical protein